MSDEFTISVEQDAPTINKNNKPYTGEPHNGSPIICLKISPNGKYLVTSREDNSIVGWNVEDVDEGRLNPDITITSDGPVQHLCVSDDKKLAYIYVHEGRNQLTIVDMDNVDHKIKLSGGIDKIYYCTFNLSNQFILYDCNNNYWIYSTQTKNMIWTYEKKNHHEISKGFKLIRTSKNEDKFYLQSNNYIYEWNVHTGSVIGSIFVNEMDKAKVDDVFRVTSNEKFICLRFKDKITVYSIELEIPIATLDIHDGVQLHNFMNYSALYSLLPSLFDLFDYTKSNGIWISAMKYCWKECLDRLKKDKEGNQLPMEYQEEDKIKKILETPPNVVQVIECLGKDTKYAFGILDGYVWKFKFEGKMEEIFFSNFNELSNKNSNVSIIESSDENESSNSYLDSNKMIDDECDDSKKIDKKTYEHLNLHLFNSDMDTIRKLFQTEKFDNILENKIIKWELKINNEEMELQASWKNSSKVGTKSLRIENIRNFLKNIDTGESDETLKKYDNRNFKSLLFDNNDIIILATLGLFIFHFNENDESISLNYFYYMDLTSQENLLRYKEEFSKGTLPSSNPSSFKLDEWTSYVKGNKESLMKHGVELLTFAIKECDLELIDTIYEKCLKYFEDDVNNKMFLNIITSTMPLLNKYYPEYIKRYLSDTKMIMDSPYNVERQKQMHLYSFSKSPELFGGSLDQPLVNAVSELSLVSLLEIPKRWSTMSTPKITFMLPYIKFVNYPPIKNWWKELILPQPSLFVETVNNKEIYGTWHGEALISLKWNAYGKIYLIMGFLVSIFHLALFFSIAIPPDQENQKFLIEYYEKYGIDILAEKNKNGYYIVLIVFGLFYLSIEVRKFIYMFYMIFKNRCFDFFDLEQFLINIMNIILHLLPVFVSFQWILTSERNNGLIAFASLFIILNFLLRLLSNSEYYVILINVGKKVFLFLVVLVFIIISSFSWAFRILLSPKLPYSLDERTINDDPNNPWNMAPTYQAFENQNDINVNSFIVQTPDENTNMFANSDSALFATYLLFTGDTSVISNWPYQNNLALLLMMVLFTSFTAIFILNVFIGLFSEAMEFDVKASMLRIKAKYLAEIELFYLLPHQRRKKEWFPDVMYYYADVRKTQEMVNQMIENKEWNTDKFPEKKQNLLKILKIKNPQDDKNEDLLRELFKKAGLEK